MGRSRCWWSCSACGSSFAACALAASAPADPDPAAAAAPRREGPLHCRNPQAAVSASHPTRDGSPSPSRARDRSKFVRGDRIRTGSVSPGATTSKSFAAAPLRLVALLLLGTSAASAGCFQPNPASGETDGADPTDGEGATEGPGPTSSATSGASEDGTSGSDEGGTPTSGSDSTSDTADTSSGASDTATETGTDGVSETCDADEQCSVPTGWSGPVLVYDGTEPAPPCPDVAPSLVWDGFRDLQATPRTASAPAPNRPVCRADRPR